MISYSNSLKYTIHVYKLKFKIYRVKLKKISLLLQKDILPENQLPNNNYFHNVCATKLNKILCEGS